VVSAVSITAEDAARHFGFLAASARFDNPTSSAQTRALLDWPANAPGTARRPRRSVTTSNIPIRGVTDEDEVAIEHAVIA
jgi:hypothetical protein